MSSHWAGGAQEAWGRPGVGGWGTEAPLPGGGLAPPEAWEQVCHPVAGSVPWLTPRPLKQENLGNNLEVHPGGNGE